MDILGSLKFSLEEAFVWYVVDERFRRRHESLIAGIDWERFKWNKAVSYANKNRVSYKFCQEVLENWKSFIDEKSLAQLNHIAIRGEYDLKRLQKTLKAIKDLWDGRINYYIIKTRDDSPTYDVDVLFMKAEDYESAIRLACTSGYNFRREEPLKGWIEVKDGIKIELHNGISWFGMKVLDDSFLFSNPKKIKLMDQLFQTLNKEAEFTLDLAHWVMDIQPLTINGFLKLVLSAERTTSWEEILIQAEKYEWIEQLRFHLSALNKLCEFIYSFRLSSPIKLFDVKVGPRFPFTIPLYIKVPFLMKKSIHDNIGYAQKVKMLQLALRRYAWTRIKQ